MNISGKVFNETHHRSVSSVTAVPYLKYIKDIAKNAILLGGSFTMTAVVESVIQGILVPGTAVYGNQLVKQLKKEE